MSTISRRNFLSATGVAAAVWRPAFAWSPRPTGGKHVTLLHVTDTHAQLEPHPEFVPGRADLPLMGGFARLRRLIERERGNTPGASFVVDGGDEFHGSGPAAWSRGEVMLAPLNSLGLDVFVPGNWEPAYGPERFRELMAGLKADVLCYNFHETESGRRLFAPARTIERDGVRVMFVGITDIPASGRQPPVMFRGMDTTRMAGLRDFVRSAREKERPDLVVAVTHTGLTISRQLAREIPEFEVVLSGHTHERTDRAIVEGRTIIVEAGSMGSFLGRLDLVLGPNGGVERHDFRLIPVTDDLPEHAETKRLVEAGLSPYRPRMGETLGRTDVPVLRYDVLETTADNLVADAVRQAAGTDVGFTNGFRFGLPVPVGVVTEADLWNLLPLDSPLKTGVVTGRQLRAYLENELELVYSKDPWKLSGGWGPRPSGLTMAYSWEAEPGRRLKSVKVDGADLRDDRKYSIASCEREGEPLDVVCRLKNTADPKVLPVTIHDAMRRHLKAAAAVSPRREGRAFATDLPRTMFSQDEILSGRSG